MGHVRDDRLGNVKIISRVDIHVADAAICRVDCWRFWFDKWR